MQNTEWSPECLWGSLKIIFLCFELSNSEKFRGEGKKRWMRMFLLLSLVLNVKSPSGPILWHSGSFWMWRQGPTNHQDLEDPSCPRTQDQMAPVQAFHTHVINSKPNWQLQTINGQGSIQVESPLLTTSLSSKTAPYNNLCLLADVGTKSAKLTSPLWGSVSSSSKWKSKCCNMCELQTMEWLCAPLVRVPSTLSKWYAFI